MVSWRPQVSLDDREHGSAFGAAQHAAGREEDVALGGDGRMGAVALGVIVGVVEEAIDRLVAAEIGDGQLGAAGDDSRPGAAGRHDHIEERSDLIARPHRAASRRCSGRPAAARASSLAPAAARAAAPPSGDAHRCAAVLRAPVEDVGNVGDREDHVQLGTQVDVGPGPTGHLVQAQGAVGIHPHPLEERDGRGQVVAVQAELGQGDDQPVAGVGVRPFGPAVAVLVIVGGAVAARCRWCRGDRTCRSQWS